MEWVYKTGYMLTSQQSKFQPSQTRQKKKYMGIKECLLCKCDEMCSPTPQVSPASSLVMIARIIDPKSEPPHEPIVNHVCQPPLRLESM